MLSHFLQPQFHTHVSLRCAAACGSWCGDSLFEVLLGALFSALQWTSLSHFALLHLARTGSENVVLRSQQCCTSRYRLCMGQNAPQVCPKVTGAIAVVPCHVSCPCEVFNASARIGPASDPLHNSTQFKCDMTNMRGRKSGVTLRASISGPPTQANDVRLSETSTKHATQVSMEAPTHAARHEIARGSHLLVSFVMVELTSRPGIALSETSAQFSILETIPLDNLVVDRWRHRCGSLASPLTYGPDMHEVGCMLEAVCGMMSAMQPETGMLLKLPRGYAIPANPLGNEPEGFLLFG